ncbi:MAG: hypothetical protein HGA54_09380, partial [Actinobacteria bacterium]|nr:hypothetical protein [Actinomycetota bacterium]
ALPGKMLVEVETDLADGDYLLMYYDEAAMRATYVDGVSVKNGTFSFFTSDTSHDYFVAKRVSKSTINELNATTASLDSGTLGGAADSDLQMNDIDTYRTWLFWILCGCLVLAAAGGFVLLVLVRSKKDSKGRS